MGGKGRSWEEFYLRLTTWQLLDRHPAQIFSTHSLILDPRDLCKTSQSKEQLISM